MAEEDITDKWLFVAYSAKKGQQDYRDKIDSKRIFAGAKGIGRFSCDRLGQTLKMYTKTRRDKNLWNVLDIDWSHFEVDPEKEFQTIPAQLTKQKRIPHNAAHGTVLRLVD